MTNQEVMQSAFDALYAYMSATDSEEDEKAHSLMAKSFFELKEALAKQEQSEPDWKALVLNHNADCESRCDMDKCGYKPYFEYSKRRCPNCPVHETIDIEYPTPQQRTWVGLTHEEIDYQAKKDDHGFYFALGALWAEVKLKEKNT